VGVHLHDVAGLRDHLLPGLGQLNFADVIAPVPRTAVLTCELDWYFTPQEILAGAEHVVAHAARNQGTLKHRGFKTTGF
jgi:sugar phosphate isomerase/epimerase